MSYWVLFYHSTVCHQLITHEIWLHSQEKKRLSNNHILGVPSYIPKFSFFHLTYICIIGVTWWRQWRQGQGHYEMTTMTTNSHHQLWQRPSVPPPMGMAMSPNMMTTRGSKMRGPRDVYNVSWAIHMFFLFTCFLSNISIATTMTPNSQHHQYQRQWQWQQPPPHMLPRHQLQKTKKPKSVNVIDGSWATSMFFPCHVYSQPITNLYI